MRDRVCERQGVSETGCWKKQREMERVIEVERRREGQRNRKIETGGTR